MTTLGAGTSLIFGTKAEHAGITLSTEWPGDLHIDVDHQWLECGAGMKHGYLIEELCKPGNVCHSDAGGGPGIKDGFSMNTLGHWTNDVFGRALTSIPDLEGVLPARKDHRVRF